MPSLHDKPGTRVVDAGAADQQRQARTVLGLCLDEVLALLASWPDGAVCATQDASGLISFWRPPLSAVSATQAGEAGSCIHACYLDAKDPVLAIDWATAIGLRPADE